MTPQDMRRMQRRFERTLAVDACIAGVIVASIITVPFLLPAWAVGLLCLVLIPTFLLALAAWALASAAAMGDEQMARALSRRRDSELSSPESMDGLAQVTPIASLRGTGARRVSTGSASPTPGDAA